ncbi:YqcC family protein [Halomonas sp. Bachu 37]|uniref:YqcC family protein n=1 Tax=Halomonas kashgarensis TaxID=3084920 RepID=UPI003216988A
MTLYQQLDTALERLEAALKASDLWRVPQPDAADFASAQPFCIDTMAMPQWLRYVFIARLRALAEAEGPMPARCDVAPAVDAYCQQAKVRAGDRLLVVKAVEEVDRLVTEN